MEYHIDGNGVLKGSAQEIAWVIKHLKGNAKETQPVKVKHKKHQHKKTCDECGRICRGAVGLGIHRATKHGYVGRVKQHYIKSGKMLPWRKGKKIPVQFESVEFPVEVRKLN